MFLELLLSLKTLSPLRVMASHHLLSHDLYHIASNLSTIAYIMSLPKHIVTYLSIVIRVGLKEESQ